MERKDINQTRHRGYPDDDSMVQGLTLTLGSLCENSSCVLCRNWLLAPYMACHAVVLGSHSDGTQWYEQGVKFAEELAKKDWLQLVYSHISSISYRYFYHNFLLFHIKYYSYSDSYKLRVKKVFSDEKNRSDVKILRVDIFFLHYLRSAKPIDAAFI